MGYVSAYGNDLYGHCERAAGDLEDLLASYGAETINGTYDKPFHWPEGDTSPVTGHSWVEVGDYILDPTREQFGSDNLVIKKTDPDARLYGYNPL